MPCQLAETCRNEVDINIIINGIILNVFWTQWGNRLLLEDNGNQMLSIALVLSTLLLHVYIKLHE